MTRRILLTVIAPLLLAASCAKTEKNDEPRKIVGTWLEGHDAGEPRLAESRYFEATEAGVVLIGSNAAFYLQLKSKEPALMPLYVRAEYQDPLGGKPASNDTFYKPGDGELVFSSPEFVKGLEIGKDYEITVRVFQGDDVAHPTDTLRQRVRSYVDTRGEKAELAKGLDVK